MESEDDSQPIEEFLDELTSEKPRPYSQVELNRLTSNFENKVGLGGFGDVYEGKSDNGVQIAVKVLKDHGNDVIRKQFMAEVSTMGKISHPNLIKLYGFCFTSDMKALVYEYMKNGSLHQILFMNHLKIEWAMLYKIAIELANGLSFLHEHCRPRVIHYDIKPNNVLIDSNLSPKIIDFGMARHSSQVEQSGYRGTSGYAAPEVGKGHQVTYKSDVYSFGMMMFEVLRKKRNSEGPGWFPGEVGERVENNELGEIIAVCGIEEKDKAKAEKLCLVALWCTQTKHHDRPNMSSVVKMLQGEIPIQKPPNPFPFYDSSAESSNGCRPLPKFSPAFTERLPEEYSLNASSHKGSVSMLESLEKRCPPGSANSVVVYATTGGNRGPFKDSNKVRSLLQSHKIQMSERDIYKEPHFREQLKELMGYIKVPLVFVKGRFVGGVAELLKMEEEDTLKTLFDGIEKTPFVNRKELKDRLKSRKANPKSRKARISNSMLELYKEKCPPGGKNSVVLYKTSRGSKKAIKDSNEIVSTLQSEQIEFSVRDIHVVPRYRDELVKLLGKKDVEEPVVFVKGRLIGGVDEVRSMSYRKLSILFYGIPKVAHRVREEEGI